jgi:hypothetical protein
MRATVAASGKLSNLLDRTRAKNPNVPTRAKHSRACNRSSEKNCQQISARWQAIVAQLCDAAKTCGDAARDSLLRTAVFC